MNKLIPRFVLALIVVAAGCGSFNQVQNPITPEYPCGTRMHQCSDGGCCWNNEDCGGEILSCRPGRCCYRGSGAGKNAEQKDRPVSKPGDQG